MTSAYHSLLVKAAKGLAFATILNRAKKLQPSFRVCVRATLVRKALCTLLVVSLFATSTPAATQTIVVLAKEWQAGFAFWLRSNELPVTLYRTLTRQIPGPVDAQEKQEERNARIARIEIQPGKRIIQVGDRLTLSAIAFDRNDIPVGGVHFQWLSNYPATQDQPGGILPNGWFVSTIPGDFEITAEVAGRSVTVNVKVLASETPGQRSSVGSQPIIRKVSSYSMELAHTGSKRGETTNTEFVDGDAYGWNSTNGDAAFSPLNERGKTLGRSQIEANSNNFRIQSPIVSLPGRGVDLDLNLTYNSRLWSKSNNANHEIVFDADKDQLVPGWSFNFGKIINMVDAGAFIIEADGSRHSFSGQVSTDPNNGERYFWGNTTDGSFIEYAVLTRGVGTSNVTTYGVAKYPNGLTVGFAGSSSIGQDLYVLYTTTIEDNNGNYQVLYCANGRYQTIVDTLGRVITFHYDNNNLLTAITAAGLKDESGSVTTRTLVRLHYRQLSLNYTFDGLTPVVRNPTIWALDTIYYPATKTGQWFSDSDSYSSYGMLRKVSERKGMAFSEAPLNEQGTFQAGTVTRETIYDYPLSPIANLTDAPAYHSATETWEGSTTGQAETHYDVQQAGDTRTVTSTLPDQTVTVEYSYVRPGQYDNGLVFKVETREGNNVLQTNTTTWEVGYQGTPRIKRKDFTNERGQNRYETYEYGTPDLWFYNQLKDLNEFDYSGNLLRKTSWTYNNSSYYWGNRLYGGMQNATRTKLLYLVASVEVFGADGIRASRAEYGYDEYDPNPNYQSPYNGDIVSTPGVVQHDAFFDPYWATVFHWYGYKYRGNLTSVKSYTDAEHLAQPLLTLMTYDTTGNTRTVTKSGKQRAFTYNTDTQYSIPTLETVGSPDPNSSARITTSATYDFNTSLELSSTDANSRTVQSTYYLDSWRLKREVSATGATRVIEYDDAALTGTETTKASDGTTAGTSISKINGRGQVMRVDALTTNGAWDTVETQYDDMGRTSRQTFPYRVGQVVRWGETFYDALGRIKQLSAPDGSEARIFYNETTRPTAATNTPGETARSVDAWGRERWTLADALGRIIEVVEPDPNGNGSILASGSLSSRFSYDTLGDLNRIEQGAQVRRFRYDSLGRLTQQKLAEADATLNQSGQYVGAGEWSDVFSYDERSNLILKIDARGVKTNFSYNNDPLDRLQSVSYDASSAGAGQLIYPAPTVTYQYVAAGDITRLQSVTATNVETETFDYDSEARPKSKSIVFASRPSYPALTEYAYDSLNRVTDIRYPAQYGTGNNLRKLVHYEYDVASRLSALKVDGADYASQIIYNAASQKTSVKVGAGNNEVNETYDYDPVTNLLSGQQVQRAGTTLLDLSYDYLRSGTATGITGQLTKIINNRDASKNRGYIYDALGRLRQATGGPESTPLWTQTYTYDRYGNRTNVSVTGYSANNRGSSSSVKEGLAQNAGTRSPGFRAGTRAISGPASSAEGSIAAIAELAEPHVALPTEQVVAKTDVKLPDSPRAGANRSTATFHHASRALPPSPAAPADPPAFTNPDLQLPGGVEIKALHITELRTAINSLRAQLGLSAYPWQQPTATGGVIQSGGLITADPILEMRTALDQALGAPSPAYAAGLAQGQPIKAIHIQELRNRVLAAWNSGTSSCSPGQTLLIDQFVKNFFQGALARQPNATELQLWTNQLRQAYYLGQSQVLVAAQYLGQQLFRSTEYSDRNRDPHGFVYDLYKAYLQREPDQSGWDFWTGQAGLPNGHENVRHAFEDAGDTEFVAKLASLCPGSAGATAIPLDGFANLSYNQLTNHITTAGFTYDAAGNQTSVVRLDGSTQIYEYDAANRMVKVRDQNQVVVASYTYGQANQRLVAQDGDENSNQRTYYVWSAGAVIAEYAENQSSPSTPSWTKSYVYLDGRLLATQEPNGSSELVQYYHPDRLGARIVTRSDGGSYEQVTLPFGGALDSESTGATSRRFTSYDRSAVSGLDYAVNRSYDSRQARFTQVDPLRMGAVEVTNPQSLNLYAYCLNDPINSADPTGTGSISISFPPFFGGFGGGTTIGSFFAGLFSFGLGLLGSIFGSRGHNIGSPFLGSFQTRPQGPPAPPSPTVVSVYGDYGFREEQAHPGNEAFFKRARFSAGGNENNIRPFGSGEQFINAVISLSNQVGRIDRLNAFFHSVPQGIIGSEPDNRGLYIDYRAHDVYTTLGSDWRTTAYPLTKSTIALGARGTEDFVNAILDGRISIANGGEIVLFGCSTDALASHLSFLLTAGGRGDIGVSGATGQVDLSNVAYASGRFNTYTGNKWSGGRSTRRKYR